MSFLSTKEAAKRLDVSSHTLREMIALGQIRGVLVCKRRRFTASEIEQFLAGNHPSQVTTGAPTQAAL